MSHAVVVVVDPPLLPNCNCDSTLFKSLHLCQRCDGLNGKLNWRGLHADKVHLFLIQLFGETGFLFQLNLALSIFLLTTTDACKRYDLLKGPVIYFYEFV